MSKLTNNKKENPLHVFCCRWAYFWRRLRLQ